MSPRASASTVLQVFEMGHVSVFSFTLVWIKLAVCSQLLMAGCVKLYFYLFVPRDRNLPSSTASLFLQESANSLLPEGLAHSAGWTQL